MSKRSHRRKKNRKTSLPAEGPALLTDEEILSLEAGRVKGFTAARLKALGVPWPPPKGWKDQLMEKTISERFYVNPEWLTCTRRGGWVLSTYENPQNQSYTFIGGEDLSGSQEGDFHWTGRSVYQLKKCGWVFHGSTPPSQKTAEEWLIS